MRIVLSAAVMVVVLALGSSANALTVTNRDGTDQKITITEGGKQRDEVVAATKPLPNICPAGCVIRLQNGEEYEFDGNEIVSIEEGLMFLDEPATEDLTPPASASSAAPQPQGSAPTQTHTDQTQKK